MTILSSNPILLNWIPNGPEMIVLLLIIVVFFGGKKIPELAKGLGKGIREFNDAKQGIQNEIESGINNKETAAPKNTNTSAGN